MPLFRSVQTPSADRRRHNEPFWDFLSRYDDPFVAFTRQTVDAWFDRFPLSEQPDLAKRMRSAKADALPYHAGCLELFTHELLLRLGAVPEVIPRTKNQRTPDFNARWPEHRDMVLESCATTDALHGEWHRLARLREALEGVGGTDFALQVFRSGLLREEFRPNEVTGAVTRFLQSEELQLYRKATLAGVRSTRPVLRLAVGGAEVRVFPVVRVGDPDPPQGVLLDWFDGVVQLDTTDAIRKAARKKATRYGVMTRPYVIVLNIFGDRGVDEEQVIAALYGTGPNHSPLSSRRNGIWHSKKNTRVSGVLIVQGVLPALNHAAPLMLYMNPWAQNAVTGPLLRLRSLRAWNDQLHFVPGIGMDQLFP